MRITRSILLASLVATAATAQTFEPITPVRFTDTTTSVRGAALGATSIPLDADASAADTNPAAIASIKRPVIGISASSLSFDTIGDEFNTGFYRSFRTRSTASALDHAFVAFPAGPFALAAWYRKEPSARSGDPFTFRSSQLPAYPASDCFVTHECGYTFMLADSSISRDESRMGGAAAWHQGNFSIGVGAELVDLDERVETPRVIINLAPAPAPAIAYDQLGRRLSSREVLFSGGLTWRALPRLTLAASYKQGGSFDRVTTLCGTEDIDSPNCATSTLVVDSSRVRRADAIRAGAVLRVTDSLDLVTEAVRRNYSVSAHDPYALTGLAADIPFRDVTELHAGAEYRIRSFALRAGWWRDPARLGNPFARDVVATKDVDHLTLGAGASLGQATRLDVSYDNASDLGARRVAIGLTQTF